ncbi:MAG: class I SAM-dependent methyltransferase, partial [Candidatus Omnitrophica bacterium]|nr:class I SAM-dependent methyltransferase [Candidatus Omnitrophota bacterium]
GLRQAVQKDQATSPWLVGSDSSAAARFMRLIAAIFHLHIQNYPVPHELAVKVAQELRPGAGARILTLWPTAQGEDELYFAAQGYQVTAIDRRERYLASFRGQANINPISGDMRKILPQLDGQFDIIYARLTLHWMGRPDLENIFRQFPRLLAPGGRICFTVKSKQDRQYVYNVLRKGREEDPATWLLTYEDPGKKCKYDCQFFDLKRIAYYLNLAGMQTVSCREISMPITASVGGPVKDHYSSQVFEVIATRAAALPPSAVTEKSADERGDGTHQAGIAMQARYSGDSLGLALEPSLLREVLRWITYRILNSPALCPVETVSSPSPATRIGRSSMNSLFAQTGESAAGVMALGPISAQSSARSSRRRSSRSWPNSPTWFTHENTPLSALDDSGVFFSSRMKALSNNRVVAVAGSANNEGIGDSINLIDAVTAKWMGVVFVKGEASYPVAVFSFPRGSLHVYGGGVLLSLPDHSLVIGIEENDPENVLFHEIGEWYVRKVEDNWNTVSAHEFAIEFAERAKRGEIIYELEPGEGITPENILGEVMASNSPTMAGNPPQADARSQLIAALAEELKQQGVNPDVDMAAAGRVVEEAALQLEHWIRRAVSVLILYGVCPTYPEQLENTTMTPLLAFVAQDGVTVRKPDHLASRRPSAITLSPEIDLALHKIAIQLVNAVTANKASALHNLCKKVDVLPVGHRSEEVPSVYVNFLVTDVFLRSGFSGGIVYFRRNEFIGQVFARFREGTVKTQNKTQGPSSDVAPVILIIFSLAVVLLCGGWAGGAQTSPGALELLLEGVIMVLGLNWIKRATNSGIKVKSARLEEKNLKRAKGCFIFDLAKGLSVMEEPRATGRAAMEVVKTSVSATRPGLIKIFGELIKQPALKDLAMLVAEKPRIPFEFNYRPKFLGRHKGNRTGFNWAACTRAPPESLLIQLTFAEVILYFYYPHQKRLIRSIIDQYIAAYCYDEFNQLLRDPSLDVTLTRSRKRSLLKEKNKLQQQEPRVGDNIVSSGEVNPLTQLLARIGDVMQIEQAGGLGVGQGFRRGGAQESPLGGRFGQRLATFRSASLAELVPESGQLTWHDRLAESLEELTGFSKTRWLAVFFSAGIEPDIREGNIYWDLANILQILILFPNKLGIYCSADMDVVKVIFEKGVLALALGEQNIWHPHTMLFSGENSDSGDIIGDCQPLGEQQIRVIWNRFHGVAVIGGSPADFEPPATTVRGSANNRGIGDRINLKYAISGQWKKVIFNKGDKPCPIPIYIFPEGFLSKYGGGVLLGFPNNGDMAIGIEKNGPEKILFHELGEGYARTVKHEWDTDEAHAFAIGFAERAARGEIIYQIEPGDNIQPADIEGEVWASNISPAAATVPRAPSCPSAVLVIFSAAVTLLCGGWTGAGDPFSPVIWLAGATLLF